ncbi:hypothetical protein Tco_0172515 [Tanacetum coccineum]
MHLSLSFFRPPDPANLRPPPPPEKFSGKFSGRNQKRFSSPDLSDPPYHSLPRPPVAASSPLTTPLHPHRCCYHLHPPPTPSSPRSPPTSHRHHNATTTTALHPPTLPPPLSRTKGAFGLYTRTKSSHSSAFRLSYGSSIFFLSEANAMEYSILVAATASDPAPLQLGEPVAGLNPSRWKFPSRCLLPLVAGGRRIEEEIDVCPAFPRKVKGKPAKRTTPELAGSTLEAQLSEREASKPKPYRISESGIKLFLFKRRSLFFFILNRNASKKAKKLEPFYKLLILKGESDRTASRRTSRRHQFGARGQQSLLFWPRAFPLRRRRFGSLNLKRMLSNVLLAHVRYSFLSFYFFR